MTTFSAFATLPDEPSAHALSEALDALEPTGVGTFEIEDGSGLWEVGAYFVERPDETKLALLAAAHGVAGFLVSVVGDIDWVAQVRRELSPVRAGRFAVFGAHDRDRISVNTKVIEIEAAMAFGTGHHATTEGCLLAIDWLWQRGLAPRRVADIGCGTGVLAMAAGRIWPARILATDIDRVAVATARANVAFNGLRHRIRVGEAPGFRHPGLRGMGGADLVLANILAKPLARLAGEAASVVPRGGVVVLSGLLTRQERFVLAHYHARWFRQRHRFRLRGWTTLVLERS